MQQDVTLERQPCAEAAARARIFSAAEAAFGADGFHVATMDDIARRAGCSKKTIYKFFSSKEDLFFGLLERSKEVVRRVRIDRSKEPEAALVEFLEEIGRIILSSGSISRRRMIMAEYTHSPALLAAAERRGEGTARLALEAYLSELERTGRHEIGEPGEAAQMLMGMALGAFHHQLLLGVTSALPPEVVRNRIAKAVRIYLLGTARG
ncbi:TetR/AcrR family transcriptional regulator [Roseomonas marmotae]|uniref:TetR/AcrR family transcriptional regulator n=1 Tax=Roseomonas marmotae TaxID=2768161 RepID=A0ABS3KAS4_9PROT|nr:TetR/AcrR family transcriptional regulator [Roseomonas marmotae]MBO1074547.1 TetR/AcrR family transcriptional regulator [Roseomonas marmotae]QTI81580.1 TetR/AcrR family transcriptional regulator [Roseomonas marmotae]